jgi:hypothetical protein
MPLPQHSTFQVEALVHMSIPSNTSSTEPIRLQKDPGSLFLHSFKYKNALVPCGSDNLLECVSEEVLMPPHHRMTATQHQATVIQKKLI